MQVQGLTEAVSALHAGGVVAYPTEAVFGLGCDPHNESALQKLIALKGRDSAKGMIVIAADYTQLQPYLADHSNTLREKLCCSEIPTTWIVSAAEALSPLLTGGRTTVAVRITRHSTAAALCTAFGGAVTSTSANLSGHSPARSGAEVRRQFANDAVTIIDEAVGKLSQPTRIIDARTNEVLR